MLQSAMQIYEKFFNDTTERIYFIVFLEKPYSLTEKHGKSSLVTRCQARCYFVAKVSHPKDGASLGESTRGKIFPLAENLRSAQQRKEDDALLLADEDGDACLSYDDLAGLAVGGTHDVQSFAG